MIKYVLLAVLGALGWWVFIDGSKLDEDQVREFYATGHRATLALDADTLCGQMADDLDGRITSYIGPRQQVELVSKEAACRNVEATFGQVEKMVALLGDEMPFDASYQINKITLSDDNKRATVEVRSVLDMAGARFVSRSVETLIRDRRVVKSAHVEVRIWVSESP